MHIVPWQTTATSSYRIICAQLNLTNMYKKGKRRKWGSGKDNTREEDEQRRTVGGMNRDMLPETEGGGRARLGEGTMARVTP